MILAMQAGNSSDRASIAANIMNVANAPGEIILPGQLAKGLDILSNGGQINYQGATNVEFTAVGESTGSFKELEIGNGKFNTIKFR
jgi:branched-chain amino acid transport system substrate-binding protein